MLTFSLGSTVNLHLHIDRNLRADELHSSIPFLLKTSTATMKSSSVYMIEIYAVSTRSPFTIPIKLILKY